MIWSNKRAWEWYDKKSWIKGFNYVTSNAVNSTEMWQKETFSPEIIRKELKIAKEIGFNSCRVFLQYIVWKDDTISFEKRFEEFVNIAAECSMSVLVVFFDDCAFAGKPPYLGVQDNPLIGVHNSQWTPSPGEILACDPKELPLLKKYVQSIISKYTHDERILAWDLYNEAGNSGMKEKTVPLLKTAFAWAREVNPSQPLTSCIWNYSYAHTCDSLCLQLSDIISFHSYENYDTTEKHIQKLSEYERPILCTEWLHRPNGNKIETHVPLFKKWKVGMFNWGLIYGKTQTNLNWDTMTGNPNANPKEWQCDLFYTDGTPYLTNEIQFMKYAFK